MSHPSDIPPVPSSVLEFHANGNHGYPQAPQSFSNLARLAPPQQQSQSWPSSQPGPSSQPARSVQPAHFTADGHYVPRPRPVPYSHGYPTPPSLPTPLTSETPENSVPRISTFTPPAGVLFSVDGQNQSGAPWPTPPAHLTALSPDQQRPMDPPHPQMGPTPLSDGSVHPTASGSSTGAVPSISRSRRPGPVSAPAVLDSHPSLRPLTPTHQSSLPPPPQLPRSSSSSHLPTPPDSRRAYPPAPIRTANLASSPTTWFPTQTDAHAPPARPSSGPTYAPQRSHTHPLPLSASPSQPQHHQQPLPPPSNAAPLPALLAAHTHGLKAHISCLETALTEAEAQRVQLTEDVVHAQEDGQRAAAAVEQRLGGENAGLRAECERLRGQCERLWAQRNEHVARAQEDGRRAAAAVEQRLGGENAGLRAQCEHLLKETERLRVQRNEAREQCLRVAGERDQAVSQGATAARESAQNVLAMQTALDEQTHWRLVAEQKYEKLANFTRQRMKVAAQYIANLKNERDMLKARVAAQDPAPANEQDIKIEPPVESRTSGSQLVPKPEPLDEDFDLELQYPDSPSPLPPLATPPPASTSNADAFGSGSTSTFYTWDPPPETQHERVRKRKRSRTQDDADGPAGNVKVESDGEMDMDIDSEVDELEEVELDEQGRVAPSLGPPFPFPLPRELDIKTRNSPVHWFMQITRKGEGG